MKIIVILLISAWLSLATSLNFSQTHFCVSFSPYVLSPDPVPNAYEEADLFPMIRTISTRFSKISTAAFGLQPRTPSIEFIPTATAKFNKNTNSSLKVMIVYKYENFTQINGKNTIPFDIALDLAEKSNRIFNSTVDTLTLWFQGVSAEELLKHFQNITIKLKEKSLQNKYRHGIGLKPSDCGVGANLNTIVAPVLKNLGFVYISYLPNTQDEYNLGPENSFIHYKKHFEVCFAKIKKVNPTIEIGMGLVWPDTDYNGHQNYSQLVLFWENVNGYVSATNTTVIMFEAFDNPYKDSIGKSMGWWTLQNQDGYYVKTEDFVFLEKRNLALNKTHENQTVHDSSHHNAILYTGSFSILTIVLGSSLLTIVAVGVVIVLAYRKMWRQIENHEMGLSKDDIHEFFEGSDKSGMEKSPLQYEIDGVVHNSRYDNAYELKPNNFEVDEASLLGKGNFGVVCKGKVKVLDGYVDTAVKMVKKSCPSTALKGLLSEIKVLSHLGQNDNLACLIGACTKDLKSGKVLVFTELCERGSLESYLRNEAKSVTVGDTQKQLERQGEMHRWSFEIASGMEFIISKGVIHADLSTRNVLLTSNLTAKISDFGLSRRLYDYISYIKKSQEPLPWRWMSPESLRRWEFTEKTDVWAYGVTLWEIYTLGVLPYGGFSWTIDFPCKLVKGMRLEEPEYNADNMYGLMLKCWSVDPERRPKFVELKDILSSQERERLIKRSSEEEFADDSSQSTLNYTLLEE